MMNNEQNNPIAQNPPCFIHSVRVSIICAAIHFDDDTVYPHQPKNIMSGFVIAGRRHHNVFNSLKCLGIDRLKLGNSIQGFITTDNRFVDRKEGAKIAFESGQTSELKTNLFSEDLY